MAAKRFTQQKKKNSGQSMIEFALLVSLLTGMFMVVIQVQSAISISIVNQKYARAQLHYLLFNHRYYLERPWHKGEQGQMRGLMYVGVAKDPFYNATPRPEAPTQKIGRSKTKPEQEPGQSELDAGIDTRQNVRIRPIVSLCLPPLGSKEKEYFTEGFLGEDTFKRGKFAYCSGL